MDKEFSSCSSTTIDSLRKAGIGLRGALAVRGGKLSSSSQNALMKKKTIAPKIPIKREKVKKEAQEPSSLTYIKKERDFQASGGRGRGRGKASKVYIQTEGTLFGEGPALILKRDRERERINIPRYSKSSGLKCEDGKVNSRDINYLLECYDDALSESDSDEDLKPIKYPLSKQDKIKKEIIDQEDVKNFIKVEPPDEDVPLKSNLKSQKEYFKVDIKTENFGNIFIEEIKKLEGEDCLLVLLQFPSSLPFRLSCEGPEKPNKKKVAIPDSQSKLEEEKQNKDPDKTLSLWDLPDGYLGKFQIMRSGKMRLVMGSNYFYLERAIDSRFLSKVVSIPLEKKEGDFINLGSIAQKMILRPHFDRITD